MLNVLLLPRRNALCVISQTNAPHGVSPPKATRTMYPDQELAVVRLMLTQASLAVLTLIPEAFLSHIALLYEITIVGGLRFFYPKSNRYLRKRVE